MAATQTMTAQQQVALVMQMRQQYAQQAQEYAGQPFGQIPYQTGGRGSLPIPPGFLLGGIIAHFHLPVTLNLDGLGAPGLSAVGQSAAVREVSLDYNGSEAAIFRADSLFTRQRFDMEYMDSSHAADVVPTPAGAGTEYTLDWYEEIPAAYTWSSLIGALNLNSSQIHSTVAVSWGDVSNVFTLAAGQTATVNGGYVEFIAKRLSVPQAPTDGMPDLSKTYSVTYQDFALSGSGETRLPISATDTITRMTLNFLNGSLNKGYDVEAYDHTNALNATNVKLGWAQLLRKYDSPFWYWQEEADKNYGQSFAKWINAGTVVVDLDRFGGRDWIDASGVTDLSLAVNLGSAPPAGSKVRVHIEQIVNSSPNIPIR